MTNVKHEQWIKCGTNLDAIARQCSSRKIFLNIFYCSQLMISGLIIFLTQHFQGEKMI
jgi:hypothetical protein